MKERTLQEARPALNAVAALPCWKGRAPGWASLRCRGLGGNPPSLCCPSTQHALPVWLVVDRDALRKQPRLAALVEPLRLEPSAARCVKGLA